MLHPTTVVEFVVGATRPASTCPRLLMARAILVSKAALRETLPAGFAHDPAVEILLSLYIAQATSQSMTFDAAALAGGDSAFVATRWIRALEQQGLVTQSEDADGRWVALSEHGTASATKAIDKVLERQAALLA